MIKSRKIFHPSGCYIETPLFIPSFSSKGFEVQVNKDNEFDYEISYLQDVTIPFLTESVLLSAYDLHYNAVIPPSISSGFVPEITIIDSGGYESSLNFDLSETHKLSYTYQEWNIDKYKTVVENWNLTHPAIIVSFDKTSYNKSIYNQIKEAIDFFENYNHFLKTILLKPSKHYYLDIAEIVENISLLSSFDILGVTEKELGSTMKERIDNIKLLRQALEKSNIDIPIHLFGCLNPNNCILYFIAGVEIFDGLSWLRFIYQGNHLAHIQSYMAKNLIFEESEHFFREKAICENIFYLKNLKKNLISFSRSSDYTVFENAELIKESCKSLNLL